MTISDFLINIKEQQNYITNSLILKSADIYGCVYKYLINIGGIANRVEIFIELDVTESELELLNKTVINFIEVYPAK